MEEDDWWKLMEGDRYMGAGWKAPWSKQGDEDDDEDEEEDEEVSFEQISWIHSVI